MTSSTTKMSRTTLQNTIKNKQQLYSRFNRRMSCSNSPAERSFIKNEMNRLCKELSNCAKQWKNCGFGNNSWVCRNCTPKSSTNSNSSMSRASSRSNRTSRTNNTRRTTRSTSKRNKRTTTTSSRKTTNNPWMFSFSR